MDRDASCALSDTSCSTAPLHPYFGMPENLCSPVGLQKAMLMGQPALMTLDEVCCPSLVVVIMHMICCDLLCCLRANGAALRQCMPIRSVGAD